MQNQINDIQDDVRAIKDALLGNEFGNDGIVKRLKRAEQKTSENRKELNVIKSKSVLYGTGAGGIFVGVVEAIKHWFNG